MLNGFQNFEMNGLKIFGDKKTLVLKQDGQNLPWSSMHGEENLSFYYNYSI